MVKPDTDIIALSTMEAKYIYIYQAMSYVLTFVSLMK